jgi:DNA polymerase I
MKSLYILDAVNFLFRSYYAIGPMTNPKGESTNALYGFIRSLFKIMAEFSPNHLVAVFDGPDNKKSRTDIYKDYKSHRKGMPEDLVPQLGKALEFCELAGIPHLSIPGVEADDTMGSIATWAEKNGASVFICSSDKDLCQLVSDHVFLIHAHKNNLLVDRNKVKELFGVKPEQIIDLLALVGDASDNIPGLEGIGPKTATALLEEFGSLNEILHQAPHITGKKGETIRNGKEIALISQKLATIHLNITIPHEESFYQLKAPQIESLKHFYQDMHFMSLLKELDLSADVELPKESPSKQEVFYTLIHDEAAFKALIESLKHHKEICIDTETTDIRPMYARMVGIGFCTKAGSAWYVPMNGSISRKVIQSGLQDLFQSEISFFGHNIKYDLHVLKNEGLPPPRISFDTILASYLLNPQNQRHNLDQLSLEKFQKVKISIDDLLGKGKSQISMDQVAIEKVCEYCCEDTDYTFRLKELFVKELEEKDLSKILMDIELPLLPVLLNMERSGIFIDESILYEMSKELFAQLQKLEAKIYDLAGEHFNINSPKQLAVILFEKLGLKPPKKTQTGYSTAADVLESLQDDSPIVKYILEYRQIEKLRSTYVDALPLAVNPDTKRIHCTFNQSVAATGRLSCQDPNLQNIPIRTAEGKKIREAFRPQYNGWSFLSADYSQIELRLLAHLSEDPMLMKAFQEGEDIHTYTASLVFNVPLDEVTPEMRYQAKAVNFGILYGQQAYGLSQGLSIHYKEAADLIETYFDRYKKVKEYIEFCKENVRKTGIAFTMTGRQRPIPEIHSKNPTLRAFAERLAVNTPLQGTQADLIKLAMIEIDKKLPSEEAFMVLQIHDELLFETPDNEIDKIGPFIKKTMEGMFKLKVPLVVDISIGKNWGAC